MPEKRSTASESRCTTGSRPLRWPKTITNIAIATTSAPAVATIVSPVAAPPAGAASATSRDMPAKSSARITLRNRDH